MDAFYSRVSSERETTENEPEGLIQIAERDGSGRDWAHIRGILACCLIAEERTGSSGKTTVDRLVPQQAAALAAQYLYVDDARSSKIAAKSHPLFEQMKRDAAARKFERLLVWKVSRLGRDMRKVIDTVHELLTTVLPFTQSSLKRDRSIRLLGNRFGLSRHGSEKWKARSVRTLYKPGRCVP